MRRMTKGEVVAYQMMHELYGWGCSTTDDRDFNDAGNWIIALAERIKAERAVVAMGGES